MVSRSQARVRAGSANPPQRSTTTSPSSVAQNEAPTSAPLARLPSNTARTSAKRSAVIPCTDPSAIAVSSSWPTLPAPGRRHKPPERDHGYEKRQIDGPEHPDRQRPEDHTVDPAHDQRRLARR